MKKGRPIFVEGRLQTRSWDKDGVKQYRTEVIAESFQFGASAGGEGGSRSQAPEGDMGGGAPLSGGGEDIQYPDEEINPEDIPF
jgi:single-strand DNA-binding protein